MVAAFTEQAKARVFMLPLNTGNVNNGENDKGRLYDATE